MSEETISTDSFGGAAGRLPYGHRSADEVLAVLAKHPLVSVLDLQQPWLLKALNHLQQSGRVRELPEPGQWLRFEVLPPPTIAGSKECVVLAGQDWHPLVALYGRQWLRMRLHAIDAECKRWTCSVWGAEGYGMALYGGHAHALDAYRAVLALAMDQPVTRQALAELGFEVF